MSQALVVLHPFERHAVGDLILDPVAIRAVLQSERAFHVIATTRYDAAPAHDEEIEE